MRINTNISSIQAQRNMRLISSDVESSARSLASGSRINSASDDAAGLALSEKLKSHVRSSYQAQRNANDGISILQTIEGNLSEAQNIFSRLKELSIQSANDVLENDQRQLVDLEFGQLKSEMKRIISTIKTNGTSLKFGNDLKIQRQMLDASVDSIDIQVGINADPSANKISFNPTELLLDDNDFQILSRNVATKESARDVIVNIDKDINLLSQSRAYLGALMNRLTAASDNLSVMASNESGANSVIRDADYAYETAKNMKSKLTLEATTNVLAQANGIGRHMLKLID